MKLILENKHFTDLLPVEFGMEQKNAGESDPPSFRDYHLIHFVLSGKGTLKKSKKTYHISQGQAFIVHPNEIFTEIADQEDPWKYMWIGFSGNLADDFRRLDDVFEPNKSLFLEFNLAFSLEYGAEEYLAGMLFKLYSDLLYEYITVDYAKKTASFINANYMQNISVSEIAANLNIHRNYLTRIFKERMGISVQQYIIQKRLSSAKKFLRSGHSVYQVAQLLGYSDQFVFSKAFKKLYGCSPLQYKSQKNKKA